MFKQPQKCQKKQVKKPAGQPKREKETKKIKEVPRNFHYLHEISIKNFMKEFHANFSISTTRNFFVYKKLKIFEYYATH